MALEFQWLYGEDARLIDPEGLLWPPETHVLFIYDEGKLIGRSSICFMPVIEGTLIEPDRRNGTIATRIMREVERRYLEFDKAVAMAFTPDEKPEIGAYLERLGFEKMSLSFYKKNLIAERKVA